MLDSDCSKVGVKNDVRALRRELGWSQAVLADNIDVSRQTVNAIERERYDPSLALAFRIAAAFGRSIEDIFHPDVRGGR